ncbi:hypothetical protein CO046_05080 [Candidatus Peregrinibacteria bacterium CG_4_9_14_0_2_um_filter_53_11]|nr:MAG: hypothetical protein CO046_05080 [Candidatus Peregrinibacteria bacterium CG_4_9_14_0_2_um_filter_53_11]
MMKPMRLDQHLSQAFPEISRSLLQSFIREVGVEVRGRKAVRPNTVIKEGEEVDVTAAALEAFIEQKKYSKTAQGQLLRSSLKDLPVVARLYETEGCVALDKPAGITTEQLIASEGLFSVHRLDKDTSGILIAAKDPVAQAALQEQWKERRVQKVYRALVIGALEPTDGAIEGGIFRSRKNRKKMAISQLPQARDAYTDYHVDSVLCDQGTEDVYSFVSFSPKTGRTHQIRVHTASIGFPIVGDATYGNLKANKVFKERLGLGRQFLHAHKLSFVDPSTKKKVVVDSPLPPDLQKVLDSLS